MSNSLMVVFVSWKQYSPIQCLFRLSFKTIAGLRQIPLPLVRRFSVSDHVLLLCKELLELLVSIICVLKYVASICGFVGKLTLTPSVDFALKDCRMQKNKDLVLCDCFLGIRKSIIIIIIMLIIIIIITMQRLYSTLKSEDAKALDIQSVLLTPERFATWTCKVQS